MGPFLFARLLSGLGVGLVMIVKLGRVLVPANH
jgi:hypothetical protein